MVHLLYFTIPLMLLLTNIKIRKSEVKNKAMHTLVT